MLRERFFVVSKHNHIKGVTMNIYYPLKRSVIGVGVAAALATSGAQAVQWQSGEWTLGLGGEVNAYYNHVHCSNEDLGAGGTTFAGLACAGSTDENGDFEDSNGVSNGLLPSSLIFTADTTQNGYDISAKIGVYYGSVSNTALAFSTVDARQLYLTFGNESMGTVLIGRDFGLFAFDAIINDMTLLGLGAAFASANPGNTSLGGLGFGYVYTDRLAQIDYSTPDFSGFKATLGVFQPLNGVATVGDANNTSSIGFQAKASYNWDGTVSGKVSTSYLSQGMDLTGPAETANVYGWDLFGSVKYESFDFLAYYYQAQGMTTLAIGGLIFPGFNGVTGQAEKSKGYMLQGTYTFGNTRFGINWAESKQTEVTRVDNEKLTLGVYHNLTPALTLVGEYSNQQSDLRDVGTDKTWNFNLGAILFF
jgi:hypothetical protein